MANTRRAVSVDELYKRQFDELAVPAEWKKLLGTPERTGSWIVYGESGQGKTSLNMQMAKMLTEFGRVEYNTLEEGARKSMQEAVLANRMHECRRGRFKILDRFSIMELKKRLRRKRSAHIVFIDSLQYTFLDKRGYKALQREFPDKLFIWVSHAEGKRPMGNLAKAILFDSDVKIRVEGFRAFSISRAARGQVTEPYTIWEEGAEQYYGMNV